MSVCDNQQEDSMVTDREIDEACSREATVEERADLIVRLLGEVGPVALETLAVDVIGIGRQALQRGGGRWRQAMVQARERLVLTRDGYTVARAA